MQSTRLANNNNVEDAVATSSVVAETATYSIPQGTEWNYSACFDFQIQGYLTCGSRAVIHPGRTLPSPAENLSTTIDDYVVFRFTSPNSTALMVWYSGPEGNPGQDCSGMAITCIYESSTISTYTTLFKILTAGNYTSICSQSRAH